MKKRKALFYSFAFLCTASIIVLTIYLIYGVTLINPNDEKSISNHLASDKSKPITIIDTAQLGDWFGILYTDPVDAEQGYIHFKYITKVSIYKNRYYNSGGDARFNTDDTSYFELNNLDENRASAELFIFGIGRNYDKTLSIFEYNENTNEYKKNEEIEVPETPFIITREYKLEESSNSISIQDEFSYVDNLIKSW